MYTSSFSTKLLFSNKQKTYISLYLRLKGLNFGPSIKSFELLSKFLSSILTIM